MAERQLRLLLLILLPIDQLLISKAEAGYGADSIGSYQFSGGRSLQYYSHQRRDYDHMRKIQAFKASLMAHQKDSLISPSPPFTPTSVGTNSRVYHVTSYGADPTGKADSTEALLKAFSDASNQPNDDSLIAGISNVGGAQINLDGGMYLISRPLRFPVTGIGNIVIQGGSLKASDNFPTDNYLVDLSSPTSPSPTTTKHEEAQQDDQKPQISTNSGSKTDYESKISSDTYIYEYITLRDIFFDCNYRASGVNVVDSLRTGIDNLFVAHFSTYGIRIQSGHETLIRDSYLGQHITAGGDPGERNFSGTAIALMGNDNVLSNVIIFSAATGVLVTGQANLLSGVHCYNKATGFGGTGIYLKLPHLTQTRIVNSYLDYTGIVVEDPVQLVVSNNFFLGDAGVTLKSVKGVANGVTIVDNIFSGSGNGFDIVRLDQASGKKFVEVDQVVVDRNSVKGMNLKATTARAHLKGNGSKWEADFQRVLLFPDMIEHVHYSTLVASDADRKNGYPSVSSSFPKANYVLRNVSDNRVVIESDVEVPASIYVMVDQGLGS